MSAGTQPATGSIRSGHAHSNIPVAPKLQAPRPDSKGSRIPAAPQDTSKVTAPEGGRPGTQQDSLSTEDGAHLKERVDKLEQAVARESGMREVLDRIGHLEQQLHRQAKASSLALALSRVICGCLWHASPLGKPAQEAHNAEVLCPRLLSAFQNDIGMLC